VGLVNLMAFGAEAHLSDLGNRVIDLEAGLDQAFRTATPDMAAGGADPLIIARLEFNGP